METEELLGSVTTYSENEQANTRLAPIRTSARVIKKLRQDVSQTNNGSIAEPTDKKDFTKSSDVDKAEKENINSQTEKDKNSSKQRMPKAVWSTMEKNLFFEALNEYGKDFDSITAHICNKMKRKGGTNNNIKTKHQVSHFYYRTWHKVSKHIQFDSNVKKVAQELYALINYGEMRKRLVSGVVSKVATRLPELVKKGVVAVRARGRTLRVRTPMCRALRKLNKIEEWDEQLRLPLRVCVQIVARDSDAWTKVQCLAHNPRVLAPVAPSCRLGTLLTVLNRKWMPADQIIRESLVSGQKKDLFTSVDTQINYLINPNAQCNLTAEFDKMTNTAETYKANGIGNEKNHEGSNKKDSLSKVSNSVVLKSDDNLNLDENVQKSSSNVNNDKDVIKNNIKAVNEGNNRLENSHNVLSNPEISINKDNNDSKGEGCVVDSNHINKTNQLPKGSILHVGPKPGVYLNLPVINISEHVTSQRICLTSYQERLEHDSLNNQSDCFKSGVRFKSQKRQRKDSGEMDNVKKSKSEGFNYDKTDVFDIDETANDGMDMTATLNELKTSAIKMILPSDDKSNEDLINDGREKDFFSELEDDDKCNNETDGENELGLKTSKENLDDGKIVKLSSARKLKFPPGKDQSDVPNVEKNSNNLLDSPEGQIVNSNKPATNTSDFFKKNWNRDLLQEQIKKGWNIYDAADLTIGDLYLMFGSNSKLELNYWWCEPLSAPNLCNQQSSISSSQKSAKETDINDVENIMSPKPTNAVNDEVDAKKSEKEETEITDEMPSPDSKNNPDQDPTASTTTYHLISKLGINTLPNDDQSTQKTDFPWSVPQRDKLITVTERLKKLLSLFQLHSTKGHESSCRCCHPCGKGKKVPAQMKDESNLSHVIISNMTIPTGESETEESVQRSDIFRTPFARGLLLPNPDKKVKDTPDTLNFKSMPPWTRRGKYPKRTKRVTHHVVVKQFLPILPKPAVQISSAPAPIVRVLPALRPKPPTKTNIKTERSTTPLIKEEVLNLPYENDLPELGNKSPSFKNALSSSDNNSSIKKETKFNTPSLITLSNEGNWSSASQNIDVDKKIISEASLSNMLDISLPSNLVGEDSILNGLKSVRANLTEKSDNFAGFWTPGESLSMSPSRLLKENDDHWIDTEVNNFSLSSFLGHLEAPTLANSVKAEASNRVNETDNEHNNFTENLSAGML